MDNDVKSVLNKEQDVNELGVSFKCCQSNHSNAPRLHAKSKRFSVKLKLYREFALATLSALAQEKKQKPSREDSLSQIHALDAYSCTGVAALQWKKLLSEDVHVTAADHEDVCLIERNAEKNVITCLPWELDPKRVPGDPKKHQTSSEIFLCQADARALMAMESFNFIYLVPHKSNSSCLEPAFHSLSIGGVLCLVVPDLSVFARAPHVVRRTFSSQVIKTEYLKEMAARVVLAEAARSAAKHNKGISVMYVVSQEDFLLIAVRVHRGQKAVDSSLDNVAHLLHCRFCEERTFLPNQLAPIDNPYSLLSCSCKSTNVGKTAIILGPMW
ncbi:tRNA (guanine(26)-n(2))-dimethyltransferase [Plakobranchus ocellatus]|uniref:tRNA (Guanine(26)-n(2))-dimethyltransferase n=1 Tax=Plakobranchus ocellatus TaxID=259542 RepID=A0AAV4A968_9GAST|nr:tRNA (guanine(26)-n(2))-dimethyltransferase [Plakobranchus ocellatus]